MIKYSYYLTIFSSFVIIIINLNYINSKSINESQLTNWKPFKGSNYSKTLSLIESTVTSEPNHLKASNNWSIIKSENNLTKELPPYMCQLHINRFGKVLSDFIQCLLLNDVPFEICLGCAQFYQFLHNTYKDLTNSSISECPHSFLNSDKLSLINNFYINSISQWTNGNCDNCYTNKSPDEDFEINNDTIYYYYLSNDYNLCLTNFTNTTCVSCKEAFDTVNDYYDSITSNYSSQVCYDIVDSMKDIRQHWGTKLECPVNSSQTLHILGIIMIVLLLPFVLYLTGRLFCQGNHKTLMRQKRLAYSRLNSSYNYSGAESTPLINPLEK